MTMKKMFKLTVAMLLTACGAPSMRAATLNDGSIINLIQISNTNGTLGAVDSLGFGMIGTNAVLVASQSPDFTFFALHSAWYAHNQFPTTGVYTVTADFMPAELDSETRGGVIAWLNPTVAKGIAFQVTPTDPSSGFQVAVIDFLASDAGGNESVNFLFNTNGTPATGDYTSAWSDLGTGYAVTNLVTLQLQFTAPSAGEIAAVTNGTVTAHVTAKAMQSPGGTNAPVQLGHTIDLLTTLPLPPANQHKVGYTAVWASISDQGSTIGDFDNLTLTGSIGVSSNKPPTVQLTGPTDQTVLPNPSDVTFTANAADSDGNIVRVDFFANGPTGNVKVASATNGPSPYSATALGMGRGVYKITAQALDDAGAVTVSSPATIIIDNPPGITLTAPSSGATYFGSDDIPFSADVTVTEGAAKKVDFYHGTKLIGTVTNAPYSLVWSNVVAGNYVSANNNAITAIVTDDLGGTTTSDSADLFVNPNNPPTVSLTSPVNGATFSYPAGSTATIPLAATAADDGTVVSVDFYEESFLIGTATSAPFTFNWPALAGSYTFTARATDDDGAYTTSQPIHVTVTVGGTTGSPKLAVTNSSQGVVISWSADFSAYTLQSNTNLASTNWTDIATTNQKTTNATTKAAQFFRLIKH